MKNLKFEFRVVIKFLCKKIMQQRKFMIDCVPCTGRCAVLQHSYQMVK